VDVTAYRQANQELAATVRTHQERTRATTTQQECVDEQRRYEADARPRVERLRQMSGNLDGCMRSSGRPDWADMGAMCGSMMVELDHYNSTACTSLDHGSNLTELDRHCDVMNGYTTRESQRAGDLGSCGGMMGGGRSGMM
jgi:hypothetical protein